MLISMGVYVGCIRGSHYAGEWQGLTREKHTDDPEGRNKYMNKSVARNETAPKPIYLNLRYPISLSFTKN